MLMRLCKAWRMNVSCTFIESLRQTYVRLNVNASDVNEVSVIDNQSQFEWIGSRSGYEVWRVDHKLHGRK